MRKISTKQLMFSLVAVALILVIVFSLVKIQKMKMVHIEFVKSMGAGINIGNSLDAHGKGKEKTLSRLKSLSSQ